MLYSIRFIDVKFPKNFKKCHTLLRISFFYCNFAADFGNRLFNPLKYSTMNLTINAVNFEMAEKLEQFIEKKMNRFERHLNADDKVEIRMSVVKPQTNENKEVKVRIAGLFAEKTADSFEEAIDACLAALEGQLERRKNG